MARKNNLTGGVPIGGNLQNPDGRHGRVTKSEPHDIAVDWNTGHKKGGHKHTAPKKYPTSKSKPIVEAPGEIGAAVDRFGKRLKSATAQAGAAAFKKTNHDAEDDQKILDTATRLAKEWGKAARLDNSQHTLMNIMSFLRIKYGWEPDKKTYSEIATFMKSSPTTSKQTPQAPEKPQQPKQPQGQPSSAEPQQQNKAPGTITQSQGTTGTTGSSRPEAPKPMNEPKVDTQSQPTQPGTENQQGDPDIGDFVQVTINGEDQFEKPRKITKNYGTGWYGVEGSTTGVTKDQIRVIQKAGQQAAAPAKPRYRVPAGSSASPKQESYADLLLKLVLMEDDMTAYGMPNVNKTLNRKQIDSVLSIVAKNMLRRGMVDYNAAPNTNSRHHDEDPDHVVPGSVISVDSAKFNTLLSDANVTKEELYRMQELARRFGNDPEDLANALKTHEDNMLAKKVMAAAIMSLKGRIPTPGNQPPNE